MPVKVSPAPDSFFTLSLLTIFRFSHSPSRLMTVISFESLVMMALTEVCILLLVLEPTFLEIH